MAETDRPEDQVNLRAFLNIFNKNFRITFLQVAVLIYYVFKSILPSASALSKLALNHRAVSNKNNKKAKTRKC